MNRRDALRLIGSGVAMGALTAHAAEPPQKTLGIVQYCLGRNRKWLKKQNPKNDLFEPMTLLEYCKGLGAGGIQVSLGTREVSYAAAIRKKAEQWNMYIEGIVSPPKDKTDVARFEAQLATAKQAGVSVVRTVVMPGRRYEQFRTLDEFNKSSAKARQMLELAAPAAEKHRVRVAVENHKDHRIAERVALLKAISNEYIGACIDYGNNFALLEDCFELVKALAPWAASVHVKDQAVKEYADGFLFADVALGKGALDLKKMTAILRKANPTLNYSLEMITRDPLKIPCMTEQYWATMPDVPAIELARTMQVVRSKRADTLATIESLTPESQATMESRNVTTSLAYAKHELGLQGIL